MAEVVYLLCMLASIACAGFLLNGYRRYHTRLLLYCCLCFVGLALNNLFLFIDVVLIPEFQLNQMDQVDLAPWRILPALFGIMIFIYGALKETMFNRRGRE